MTKKFKPSFFPAPHQLEKAQYQDAHIKFSFGELPDDFVSVVADITSRGGSWLDVCHHYRVGKKTLEAALKKSDSFSFLRDLGDTLSERWWLKQATENLMEEKDGPKLNATLWKFIMKNRFGWTDTVDQNIKGSLSFEPLKIVSKPPELEENVVVVSCPEIEE